MVTAQTLMRLAPTASCATSSSTPQAIRRWDFTLQTAIQGLILLPNSILKHLYYNTNPPGATMISYFLLLSLKNVRSFCGSISLTTPLAFWASECTVLAYVCVVELSSVVLIGIPEIGAKYDTDWARCTNQVDQIIMIQIGYTLIGVIALPIDMKSSITNDKLRKLFSCRWRGWSLPTVRM